MFIASTIILGLAVFTSLLVPLRAKTDADLVIVIDILSFQVLGLCCLLAIYHDNPIALKFGLLVAMLGFLTTIVLARFIKRPKS